MKLRKLVLENGIGKFDSLFLMMKKNQKKILIDMNYNDLLIYFTG